MDENIPSLAYININVNFTIVTKNAQSDRCSKGGSKVISQVQSSSTGDVIPVAVEDNQDGTYSASVVLKQAGEVKLSIIIDDRCIQGNPYSVSVCRNYYALNCNVCSRKQGIRKIIMSLLKSRTQQQQ